MIFRVELSDEAQADIRGICDYIARDSPSAAKRMRERLKAKILSLEDLLFRHGLAEENHLCQREIRQTFVGVYRLIYHVHENRVTVFTVRHGSRQPLTRNDLRDIKYLASASFPTASGPC